MSSISEEGSLSLDLTAMAYCPRNNALYMARSPSFYQDISLKPTQQQSSQSDTFSSGHNSNSQSHVFTMNEQSTYPGATSPPAHVYGDLLRRSSTPSLPSRMPTLDGHAEDLQYAQLDQGMDEKLGTMVQYLPSGPQKRSTTEIRAFSQLSRKEQQAANQAYLVRAGSIFDVNIGGRFYIENGVVRMLGTLDNLGTITA
ncbi:hypothetical protein C8J56DRAFT_888560 [Mycena floridula]|nr:hypothetical protein C8J56DRAFT_888560 [Mycena floridula]